MSMAIVVKILTLLKKLSKWFQGISILQNNDSISKSKTSSSIPYTLVNSNYCLSQNVYLINICI